MDDRKEYYESYADEWDKMFTAEDLEILSFLIDSFNIKQGSKIVDLGCGTGVLFDLLRRKVGENGLIIGVDFCPKMTNKAKQNFPFETISEVDADVEYLPLKPGIFDSAISFAAFAHFTDPHKVMLEVSRVLKEGGSFHIIHLYSSRELEEYHHKTGGPVANDHLPNRKDMIALFEHGNFENIKITDHPGLYLASAFKK
jgi:ubiquinone/menaquinone biosynthesis C-methylase UbiE